MKKSALTIGLFSLVMVATSFTTPETTPVITNSNSNIIAPIDGQGTREGRHKSDFANTGSQSNSNDNLSDGFAQSSQSTRMTVKLD